MSELNFGDCIGCGLCILGCPAYEETGFDVLTARGIDARVVPGQSLAFNREFDAVFSNAALHWVREAEDAVRCITAALKPGGADATAGWPGARKGLHPSRHLRGASS